MPSKFALRSKTIRGVILAALPLLGLATEDSHLVTQWVDALITAAGLLVATMGRFDAQQPIHIRQPKND